MRSIIAILITFLSLTVAQAATLDLAGTWRFALDPNGVGQDQGWCHRELEQEIKLPGSIQEQGMGERPSLESPWTTKIGVELLDDPRFAEYVQAEDFQCPFWLTPKRVYVGQAWFQRTVDIPSDWKDQRVTLTLERPHWQTRVWVGDKEIGTQNRLGTAHVYDLTESVTPGQAVTLTICVDNGYGVPVGKDAHSISDQTQSNWNGITGRIELTSEPLLYFEDVQVYPDVTHRQVRVKISLGNQSGQAGRGTLFCQAIYPGYASEAQTLEVTWETQGGQIEFVHDMGEDCVLWDEFHPERYCLVLNLDSLHEMIMFGMREVTIEDKQFVINGRPMFLRGTLECCIFPLHGYPPTDVAEWKRIIGIAKSYGLNHFRFHSWCPPEAAFAAADQLGFYLQVEGSCWAGFGDGTALDQWIYDEIDAMIKAYGNHPSWLFFCPSNEPSGRHRDEFLGKYLDRLKRIDPRRYYVAGAGWPQIEQNQYSIEDDVRLQRWESLKFDQPPQTFDDYRSHVNNTPVPVISHEIGQWCAYPDLDEANQYTGVLQARNLEVFRDKLNRAGMGHLAREFLMASGHFQAQLYKQEIEAALRTPGFAGFQLLDLHDFPGQGTAPVGVLNALWQNKGYISAEQYRRFCNDVVPLARLKKRVWTNDQTLEAVLDVANYGPSDLSGQVLQWDLRRDSGRLLAHGRLPVASIPTGTLTTAGRIEVDLAALHQAERINLQVRLQGTDFVNDWNLWIYPAQLPQEKSDVLVTSEVESALERLRLGGKVLLSLKPEQIVGDCLGTFRPIFWNRITFPTNPVHTLGILCDPDHPALAHFPSDSYSTWQWQGLLDGAKPLDLTDLPVSLTPIVRSIDDWNDCRRLAVLLETQVEGGRLMLTSMDLLHVEQRSVARQLRYSLLHHMESPAFQPTQTLTKTDLLSLTKNHH